MARKLKSLGVGSDKPLWVTGHSLGAALSTLATVRLQMKEGIEVQGIYNFGSPRVFNKTLAEKFDYSNRDRERLFRFVNNNDVVTRVPAPVPTLLHPLSIYKHVGTLKYFSDTGDLLEEVSGYNWIIFRDHIVGRINDLGELEPDGAKDHSMKNYCMLCLNLLNKEF